MTKITWRSFHTLDAKEPFEEAQKLLNDGLFLFGTVATAESGDRRHQLVDVSTSGLDRTITEGTFDKLTSLLGLQFLLTH